MLVAASLLLLLGCGGDDDAEARPLLESAGGAAAANGARLDDPPGSADRVPLEGFDEVAIAIVDADGDVRGWCVLLAQTPEQRQQGLMEVEDLGGYPGMLFVWDEDSESSFHMSNTPMPLSIAWFDAEGELVSEADMAPCIDVDGCPFYPSGGSYRFALEVPQGQLDELGVGEGSTLRAGGDCAPRAGPD